MAVDKETADFVRKTVAASLPRSNSGAVQHEIFTELQERLHEHDKRLDLLIANVDADRKLLSIKLEQLTTSVQRLIHAFDGESGNSISLRLTRLEDITTSLRTDLPSQRSWWIEVAVRTLPVILSWIGMGAAYLAYLGLQMRFGK